MATNFLTFRSIGIRASAVGAGTDTTGRSKSSFAPYASSSSASNWWSPLFGWSSDPDYIDSDYTGTIADIEDSSLAKKEEIEANPARSKFPPGGFTEEKARRLRMMTTGTESFHDVMYHSAIASRLASDFPRRSDQ